MSRSIFNHIKLCTSQFLPAIQITNVTSNMLNAIPKKFYADKKDDGFTDKKLLNHTTIMVQNGIDIQELPIIVRKVASDGLTICNNGIKYLDPVLDHESEINLILGVEKLTTTNGIFELLNDIPFEQLSPKVAFHAMEKVFMIETLFNLKNLESTKVMEKLITTIAIKGDNRLLLKTLHLLKDYKQLTKLTDFICEELLVRASENFLSPEEVCESVVNLCECDQHKYVDKFWAGLSDQDKHVTADNIKFIYNILPKMKISRRLVLTVAERHISNVWWQLKSDSVIEILSSLKSVESSPYRTMQSLTRWINTNIHAISEIELELMIKSFTCLNYTDTKLEKSLERYMKAKGVRVKSQSLIVTILEYCSTFRYRNTFILDGCSEYFTMNSHQIEPGYFKSIIQPFAYLNYQPLNSIKFWQSLELKLNDCFADLPPSDIIEIMLACTVLEKYPLNFINRIFNPYFLDLMHQNTPESRIQKLRSDLKLFDTALTLECDGYNGPMLPKDHHAKSVWHDGRIKRIVNQITDSLTKISGGDDRYTKFAVLAHLPVNELYIVDVLLHPAGMGNLWSIANFANDKSLQTAILIHLPEHFNSVGDILIGPQAMRIRHLRKLGIRVVTLSFPIISRLRMHPKELEDYLVERMKAALPGG